MTDQLNILVTGGAGYLGLYSCARAFGRWASSHGAG